MSRWTTPTIAFSAGKLEEQPEHFAGIFQFGYLVNLATGCAAFLAMIIVAPLVGDRLIDPQGALLLLLYSLTLIFSTVDVTSGRFCFEC